jgi:cation diffusion facilitator family transporter
MNLGHGKAEYFSWRYRRDADFVGCPEQIWSAFSRLLHPKPLDNLNVGLLFSVGASLINLVVAIVLIKNGKKRNSIVLEADGKHLMTDVWTSAGVIVAILIVKITGINILDPIIAILVAINIIYTGYQLISRSANGLMDVSISEDALKRIIAYLDSFKEENIEYHSLMTRQADSACSYRFICWFRETGQCKKEHDYADKIEQFIENMLTFR